jgi:very-short-patch-repair endonuclease
MFTICERFNLPLPEPNVYVAGWKVDFYFRDYGVVVEVDPYGNHHTPAQIDRDRRKDLALRTHNLVVNRYSRDQVQETADTVGADLAATLSARSPAGS